MIKAIKTAYGGYLFRSRLEARWAVFFDELNIKYKYEPEMAEVGRIFVQNYIPDFYLPDIDVYVEIKGQTPTEREIRKAAGWVDDSGPVLILYGGMDKHGAEDYLYKNSLLLAFPWETEKASNIPLLYKGYAFCECPKCKTIDIGRDIIPDVCNPLLNRKSKCFTKDEIKEIFSNEEYPDGRYSVRLLAAYEKARNFKFSDELQKFYRNQTIKSNGAPTQRMINYAKYLCRKANYHLEYEEIENMNYQEVSDLIDHLLRR